MGWNRSACSRSPSLYMASSSRRGGWSLSGDEGQIQNYPLAGSYFLSQSIYFHWGILSRLRLPQCQDPCPLLDVSDWPLIRSIWELWGMGTGCWRCVISSEGENSQWTDSHLCQQLLSCTSDTLMCIYMHLRRGESINTDGMVKMSRPWFKYNANEKQMKVS